MARWARALVTGASSGIGEALARQLASEGTDLVLVARTEPRLRQLADELGGVAAEILPADLAVTEDVDRVAARIRAAADPVDLVVNNAGFGTSGEFADLPLEGEQAMIDVNVSAVVRLTHAAVRAMAARGGGAVVNVASVVGFVPSPGMATYAATKSFVITFSQGVHEEAKDKGVVVTAVAPGLTRTQFQSRANVEVGAAPDAIWQDPDEVAVEALDAAAGGRALVSTGVHNKALAGVVKLLPSSVARKMAAQFREP